MRVLHITNWYYSKEKPHKVPFIKEHLDALNLYGEHDLVHIEVIPDRQVLIKDYNYQLSSREEAFITKCRWNKGRVTEWLTWRLLKRVFKKYNPNKNYDAINFVAAYPSCVNVDKIRKHLNIPFSITEHWTAYHFNFNMPLNTTKLDRIKNIFHRGIPIITVSKALANDIKKFSGQPDIPNYVIGNVVNPVFFQSTIKTPTKEPTFFMVNVWRTIKSPLVLFEAFRIFLNRYPNSKLNVGGYGPLWGEMEAFVEKHQLNNNIQLMGRMAKKEIADHMNGITAFIHAASHETFSVVSAEAQASGCPIVVSNIPAVSEFVETRHGIKVDLKNSVEDWVDALSRITINNDMYDRVAIREEATQKFTKEAIGRKYTEHFQNIISRHNPLS